MGILNVTPDSFSDGGLYRNTAQAVDHALRMVDEGADIIDIGGESTRPGSEPVSLDEELRRVIPVIETLSSKITIPLSIDTYKADVACHALEAGASMVNDISGLRVDPEMPRVISEYKVPIILMHIKGSPKNMQENPVYEVLISEIMDYFRVSMRLAAKFSIPDSMFILDPGIGFGKSFNHNLEILNRLDAFTLFEKPLLVGPSRKAFIGSITGTAVAKERIYGTASAVAISIIKGANIIRVHDVKEMVQVARVADAVKRERIAN